MYVIVVYDSDPEERKNIRSIVLPHLNWIQNSVFAGELTRAVAMELCDALKEETKTAKITMWLIDRKPEVFHIGVQEDMENMFI